MVSEDVGQNSMTSQMHDNDVGNEVGEYYK